MARERGAGALPGVAVRARQRDQGAGRPFSSALGAQGFPSACLQCDLSSFPIRTVGRRELSERCHSPGARTERILRGELLPLGVQCSLLKEPSCLDSGDRMVLGQVSQQRALTSLSDPQWLPPAGTRQRLALSSWSLSFQRRASSELSLLLHEQ